MQGKRGWFGKVLFSAQSRGPLARHPAPFEVAVQANQFHNELSQSSVPEAVKRGLQWAGRWVLIPPVSAASSSLYIGDFFRGHP